MQDLKHREDKMQEKRKNTSFRDFLKEICSWRAMPFYRVNNLISRYPDSDRICGVVPGKEFISQRDGLLNAGFSFEKNKSFFENVTNLFKSIPLENTLLFSGCENSEYSDQAMNAKNCYLSYVLVGCENVLYSMVVKDNSINILNCISVVKSENVYQSFNIMKSYNIFYSKQIDNSSDIWFSVNMIGCHECILCNELTNKSFCIENIEYEKEEYMQKKKNILDKKTDFFDKSNLPTKIVESVSTNVSGIYITESSNIHNGYYLQATHDSQNVMLVSGGDACKYLYDTFTATGGPTGEGYYGIMGCTGGYNIYNSVIIPRCTNTYYSYGMESCSYCLGCIGLVNKSFCIFNKQYTKEERFAQANEIFAQMDKDGTLGAFFPGSMNPFYFNDTAAYLIDDSFTKEEVTAQGYLRREEEIKVDVPTGAEVITTSDLDTYQGRMNNGIFTSQSVIRNSQSSNQGIGGERHIDKEILKKVIKDDKGNYYRIVPMELEFLQKYGLPLPEIHWLDRIKLGFKFK